MKEDGIIYSVIKLSEGRLRREHETWDGNMHDIMHMHQFEAEFLFNRKMRTSLHKFNDKFFIEKAACMGN